MKGSWTFSIKSIRKLGDIGEVRPVQITDYLGDQYSGDD